MIFTGILKISDFERNIFGILGQSSILPVRKFVGGQNVSEKNIPLSLLSAIQAKDFHTSDKNLPAVLGNLGFTCPEEGFRRKNSWKKISFNIGSEYQRKVLRLSAFFFRHALHKLHLSFSEQYVGGKKCLRRKRGLYFFRILSGRISQFGQNSWGSIDKTAFFVPREKLRMILFVKKSNFSNSFCLWAEEFRTSREKT